MFTLEEISAAVGGKLIDPSTGQTITGVSCDSRTLKKGDLFVPLKGEHFDGHTFLEDVFQKGASAALVDRPIKISHPLILVQDTLKALQQLASYYKKRFQIPTIAVTGSAGKTTTKECIGMAFSKFFKVRVSLGNWNNHLGVPLNLFQLNSSDQFMVLELGANHIGEIKVLSEMAQPSVGVITGIYPVHLEGFGSLEGIYKAKLELADYLDHEGGTVIANGDDPILVKRLQNRHFHLITFGTTRECDYQMSNLSVEDGTVQFNVNQKYHFNLKGYGSFNARNVLAAIATAGFFDLNLQSLSESWKELPKINNRFKIEHWQSHHLLVVDDSYNANPKSFEQAIESFKEIARDRRKIIVIGDMLELGEQACAYHENLGRFIAHQKIDVVIAIGPLSRYAIETLSRIDSHAIVYHFEKVEMACSSLISLLKEDDSLLIKGSHSMELYKVKPYLEERFNTTSASV